MTTRWGTCAFTGHRPAKLPWGYDESDPRCLSLKRTLADVVDALYGAGCRHFICGMAAGADMYFGEAVVALRDEHPDVTLEAAVPFEGQERRWSASLRRRYARLAEACDTITVLSPEHTATCMMDRNRYMVDHASVLVAVYSGGSGGTKNTLDYAAAHSVETICLPVPR